MTDVRVAGSAQLPHRERARQLVERVAVAGDHPGCRTLPACELVG